MGDELSMDYIMTGDEVEDLFTDEPQNKTEDTPPSNTSGEQTTTEGEEVEEEINSDTLFVPEGVGSEENQGEGEDTTTHQGNGSSPDNNFYSSIATACVEDGIFPDLDEEFLKTVKDAEGFKEALNKQMKAMLDERQRMISEALEYGVEPDDVRKYQNVLEYIDNISEEAIKEEGEAGIALRKKLIYNDYLNRGFSEERAKKYTQRSFDQGTDIDDALDAKLSNKEFYSSQYENIVEQAKKQAEQEALEEKKRAESVRKTIMETEEPFEGVKLDKATRQRVFETISKPVYKDKDGNMYTALQKAQHDDEEGFIRKLGYIFTLTDGFKNLDGLVKGKVQKETKRGLQKLEQSLRTPPMPGEPRFASGVGGVEGSKSRGVILDI
jgi:hypothetical protein|nr:MAG TPA: hypothetical protein [Crassvirales sp.]